ncbi:hypothetical protein COC69_05880 [Bacillus cereus]|uniref:Uncharacterized protein n=1 Tax=Bacillus cereus TaxID=1396 RepID=A0A9X7CRB5_BACCE|nr:hypothetical protein [Bacillus cereus]PGS81658.1 hypothetical protein COC69_05880 [Bacillus cereus]
MEFNVLSREQENTLHSILTQLNSIGFTWDDELKNVNFNILDYLITAEYFKSERFPIKNNKPVLVQNIEYHYRLHPTKKAMVYFKQRKAYREKFKYENIKIPVIASIVTTVITSGIIWLFSQVVVK